MTFHGEPGDRDPLDLRGVVPPTITAFDGDEELDEAVTRAHVRFVVDAGVHGVFPLGTNGEFALLDGEERDRVIEVIVDEVGGEVPVLAGVGAPSARETVRRATAAADAGADGLVAITPYYYDVDPRGLAEHYRRVAGAVDVPVYAYNFPAHTGNGLDLDALDAVLGVDGVVGLKDSSGDLEWLGRAIADHSEHTFLVGSDALLFGGLVQGCAGAVSGLANVFPAVVLDLYDALEAGDLDRARELQARAYELRDAITRGPSVAGTKAALDLRGFDVGPPRTPLRGLDDDERAALAADLREIHGDEIDLSEDV